MKFLIVVHYFSPHIGGMETVAEKQAHSLRERGHDVTIVTCRPNRDAPLREEKQDGTVIVRLHALNFIESVFGVTFPVISPFSFFTLFKLVRRHDTVHIHDVFYMTSHFAGVACLLHKKNYYLTQHVAMVDFPNKFVMFVQSSIYKTFGKLLFSHARHIVCYNKNVETFLASHGVSEGRVTLTYNGIDTNYYHPVVPARKHELRQKYNLPTSLPIVLFVGRLVPKKGYDILAQATSKAYHVLIVGGDETAKQRSAEGVTFFGGASGATLKELYQLSDVFAFPAIGEMLTLVQQEAMACGLAQLTAENTGYNSYSINPKLFAFTPRTSDALKSELEAIVRDSHQMEAMGAYARELAESRFDWDKNYTKEYDIYSVANS